MSKIPKLVTQFTTKLDDGDNYLYMLIYDKIYKLRLNKKINGEIIYPNTLAIHAGIIFSSDGTIYKLKKDCYLTYIQNLLNKGYDNFHKYYVTDTTQLDNFTYNQIRNYIHTISDYRIFSKNNPDLV